MKRMSRLSYSTGLRMREIKHGKWVSTGNALGYTEYHCSACDNYLFLVSWKDELYNYCPYCGAKMDKE
jgi:DNA-directed RNA polymerase subunit RPC12/RpoP